jgi:protein pelota
MGESAELEKFFSMAMQCSDRVTYGPKSVELAMKEMGVKTLLLSDRLFRSQDVEKRKFYVSLYERAKRNGCKVVLFGGMTTNGMRLNGLTGIAAILHMEMPHLDEMLEGDDDDGDLSSDEEEKCSLITSKES